jgi:ABC-type branched-subunit amino acid transport system substrate-binding protein
MATSRRALLGGAITAGGVGHFARRVRAQIRPIRIGVINDQSGPNSAGAGTGSNTATRMAVEDFGGSVIGLPIEVLIADHQNKPDIGAAIVRKWYDEDGVDIVVDIAHSGVALAVQEITRAHDRIAIYSTVGTTLITESACSPNGFSWIYDAYALTNALVGAIAKQGFDSWYLLVVDYAFGQSLEAEARRFTGIGRMRRASSPGDSSSGSASCPPWRTRLTIPRSRTISRLSRPRERARPVR